MKCLRRLLPELNLEDEKIPPETLEKINYIKSDFENAHKGSNALCHEGSISGISGCSVE